MQGARGESTDTFLRKGYCRAGDLYGRWYSAMRILAMGVAVPAWGQCADEVLRLPMFNGMSDEEIAYAIGTVNRYSEGDVAHVEI